MPGARRNFYASNAGISAKSSKPAGARHPVAWLMPQQAGGLASHNNAKLRLTGTALGVMGKPAQGSATITIDATATGGLIVSGSGSATITLSATGDIKSIASASGSASITLSASAAIGAIAGLTGAATITISGTATSYAIGYMSGTSSNETEFSADALARAVWEALATEFNTPGSMGEKLNGAASAGDPWGTTLPGSYADGTAGKILGSKLLTTAKFLGLK